MSSSFVAAAQYNDWEGTIACDDRDQNKFRDILKNRGLISDKEFCIAIDVNDSPSSNPQKIDVSAVVVPGSDFEEAINYIESSPNLVRVRYVDTEMSTADFVSLFKIFNIKMTLRDIPLCNCKISRQN